MYITFRLTYVTATHEPKMKEIHFQLLPLDARYLLFHQSLEVIHGRCQCSPLPLPPPQIISLTDNKLPTVINLNLLCERKN